MNVIPINIDLVDLFSDRVVSAEQVVDFVDGVVKDITASYALQLEKEASTQLKSTRNRFIQNIRVVDDGKLKGSVLLDYSKDRLVKMIEEGTYPFDMKDGFMKSSKIKVGKNGKRYLIIPFRWSTPGSVGQSEVFSNQLPKEVYKIAKAQPKDIPVAGGGMRSMGLQLEQLPEQFQTKGVRPEIQATAKSPLFEAYQHKNSIYEGVTAQQDGVTGQNRYFSFRRVSENSDPRSWIHKGMEAKNLMEKTYDSFNMEAELGLSIDNNFANLFS